MSNDFSLRCAICDEPKFEMNLTHNLTKMANKCGLYGLLWHPNNDYTKSDEYPVYTTAKQMINTLEMGINLLTQFPDYFRSFNPENGWGNYDDFLKKCKQLLNACKEDLNTRPYANI